MANNSQSKLLDLNAALEAVKTSVRGIDIKIKFATSTSVKYIVKSNDRQSTREILENQLKIRQVGKVTRQSLSDSSMEVTKCEIVVGGKRETHTFVYKPIRGGMSQTTLNASITELFPCIAFTTGIRSRSIKNVRDFYEKIMQNNNPGLSCYLNSRDAKAGREFIVKAEDGKFEEKAKNAINVLRWLEAVNRKHPIANVIWGYRAKPAGVMPSHPGDIFIRFKNGQLLGVSLKAGGKNTDEPKLNTYIRPIFQYYGKLNEYEKLKDKLWPQYLQIPGITEEDKKFWGKNNLAQKTYAFENVDKSKYDQLYDMNLEIIKQELIKLLNSDFSKTKSWLLEKVAQQQQDVPLVVVKATQTTARRDKSGDVLAEALASVTSIVARPASGNSKQSWNIVLRDGSILEMDFTTRTNKVGATHKLGQFENLAVKFNKVKIR
jgi:hypothetical protein